MTDIGTAPATLPGYTRTPEAAAALLQALRALAADLDAAMVARISHLLQRDD